MELEYTYRQDGKFFVGHLDEYPEYPTQGFSIDELELNLLDIHNMIKDGTPEGKATVFSRLPCERGGLIKSAYAPPPAFPAS
jgi:hypothetical protein